MCINLSACASTSSDRAIKSSNSDKSDLLSQQETNNFLYSESQSSSDDSIFITDIESPKGFTKIIKNEKLC